VKILVATDGSAAALHAVEYAAALFAKLAPSPLNKITLVSVHDDAGLQPAKAFVGADAVADYLRDLSETELKLAREILDVAGVRHDTVIRCGHVSQQIVDCARSGGFDLIVLGAKGRGAIRDILLGSVAHRVLSMADIPVVLVK
jgi:nucleotide-binding universal stress UspA family protein